MMLYFGEKQELTFLKKLALCGYFLLTPWVCLINASEEKESNDLFKPLIGRTYCEQTDEALPDQPKKKKTRTKRSGSGTIRPVISDNMNTDISTEKERGRKKKKREKEGLFNDFTACLLETSTGRKVKRSKEISKFQKQTESLEKKLDLKKTEGISNSTAQPLVEEKADTHKRIVVISGDITNEGTDNKRAKFSGSEEKSKASSAARRRQGFSSQRSKSVGTLSQNLRKSSRSSYGSAQEKLPQNSYSVVIKHLLEKNKFEYSKHNLSFVEIAKLIKFTSPFFINGDEIKCLSTTIHQHFPTQGFMEKYTALEGLPFFKEEPSKLSMIREFEGEDLTWDIGNISKALTLGFVTLFQALTFEDIKKMVISQTTPPKIIEEIGSRFDHIASWFALQILAENEEIKRQDKVKTIFMIGRLLHEKRDYCSAAMIASVVTMVPVNRLLVDEQPGKKQLQPIYSNDENWQTISCFAKVEGNFRTYHDLLGSCQGEPCLPVFSLVLHDLIHTYGTCGATIQEYPKKTVNILKEMANTLEMVSNAQSFPAEENASIRSSLNFFWNLPGIPQETLEELSHLHKEWRAVKRSSPPPFLRDWNASHFVCALYGHACESQIKTIFFDWRIYDGAGIVKYIGNRKKEAQKDKLRELGLNDTMIEAIISSYNYQE